MILEPIDITRFAGVPVKTKRTITQADLVLFEKLGKSKRKYDLHRKRLLELYQKGAMQEEGELQLSVEERSYRSTAFENLVKLLGEEQASAIRDSVEPTISHVVSVKKST
jgi:hypothetical protein